MENIKNILENLFSPLSKDYCVYFYFLSVISFICVLISILLFSAKAFKNKGKTLCLDLLTVIPLYLVLYFKNRLLYSMCIN